MPSFLSDLLCRAAEKALALQQPDGSFPPGHNGPWGNVDTPVRCTSHWLILLTDAHRRTGAARLRDAASRACAYLTGPAARPHSAFHCCISDNPFMATNGLIGQAWAIEGLLEFGELDAALAVARQHRFNDELGLWHMLGLAGEIGPPHQTLNQQIWFSVMALCLAQHTGDRDLEAKARRFFACLPRWLKMDGRCIDMLIRDPDAPVESWGRYLRRQARRLRSILHEWREIRAVHEQTLGYLGFTLYALAYLHQRVSDLPLWSDPTWQSTLTSSVRFADEQLLPLPLEQNRYAFSYNPLGFEMALVKQSFGDLARGSRSAQDWLDRQLRDHWDAHTEMMTRNTGDANILAARIYQACRIQEAVQAPG